MEWIHHIIIHFEERMIFRQFIVGLILLIHAVKEEQKNWHQLTLCYSVPPTDKDFSFKTHKTCESSFPGHRNTKTLSINNIAHMHIIKYYI